MRQNEYSIGRQRPAAASGAKGRRVRLSPARGGSAISHKDVTSPYLRTRREAENPEERKKKDALRMLAQEPIHPRAEASGPSSSTESLRQTQNQLLRIPSTRLRSTCERAQLATVRSIFVILRTCMRTIATRVVRVSWMSQAEGLAADSCAQLASCWTKATD